jgi:hypothetical protein
VPCEGLVDTKDSSQSRHYGYPRHREHAGPKSRPTKDQLLCTLEEDFNVMQMGLTTELVPTDTSAQTLDLWLMPIIRVRRAKNY